MTNEQDEEMDMIDDIIHELAHAVEINNDEIIYGSGSLQREFLAKRKISQPDSQIYTTYHQTLN